MLFIYLFIVYLFITVKAGGMRIVQHKHDKAEPAPAQSKEDEEEFGAR